MYPEEIVRPCREELTSIGITELRSAPDVEKILEDKTGTTLVVINSVCGCAAGGARPAVALALQNAAKPDRLTTVFAGVDKEAVDKVRSYLVGYPPSSPGVALFKDGTLVYMMERHDIEGYHPEDIAQRLRAAFDQFCQN